MAERLSGQRALVQEEPEPVFAEGDEIRVAIARDIREVEVDPHARAESWPALVDDVLDEALAVPREVPDAEVVLVARVTDGVRPPALAGAELGLAVAVDVRPDHGVALRDALVDDVSRPCRHQSRP